MASAKLAFLGTARDQRSGLTKLPVGEEAALYLGMLRRRCARQR